jgi:uncharacterized protein (TIGR00251 family)
MKITAQIKPNSRKESVEPTADGTYIIRVNAPPVEGKANERVIELLSTFFNVPKSKIKLTSGQKSKRKVFQVGN